MAIKKITISNFKSFDNLEVEFHKFNLLIGANASGKSNFIQVFKFLRDLSEFVLENAISMQSGIEYLRNLNIGSAKNFSIEVTCDTRESYRAAEEKLTVEGYEATYGFALKFTGVSRFEVIEEKLLQKCNFYGQTEKGKTTKEKLGKGEIEVYRKGNEGSVSLNPPKGLDIDSDKILEVNMTKHFISGPKRITSKALFIENLPFFVVGGSLQNTISSIAIYDFDPKSPKKAQKITGRAELEEDGSNLAITLKNIMRSGNSKRKLLNLLHEVLPFVNDLGTETFADKSLMFKLRESYSGRKFLPASLMSDGTINLTALIIALYFEDKPLKIIEEPERNIHPYLISRMVNMMQEASKKTQLIITTHNPEMIKHVDLDDILLVSRDKDGFSRISRPAAKEEIKLFLKDDMGIEELYIRNLLEM